MSFIQKKGNDEIFQKISHLIMNLPPGPPLLPLRYFINLQKGLTFPFLLLLMNRYNNYSLGCYQYLAIHGSYGLFWLTKDLTFPDKKWQQNVPLGTILLVTLGLVGYWVLPYMMACKIGIQNPTNLRICSVFITYVTGVVFMMLSYCQKYYTLKFQKGLISEGMFAKIRNPNYLGEILIYLSFAMSVGHPVAYAIPMTIWLTVFLPFMKNKDISLKKKKGWSEYSKDTYLVLFRFFEDHKLNLAIYAIFASILLKLYFHK